MERAMAGPAAATFPPVGEVQQPPAAPAGPPAGPSGGGRDGADSLGSPGSPAAAPSPRQGPFTLAWDWAKGPALSARLVREAVAITVMLTLYRLGRGWVAGKDALAAANAQALIGAERAVGIFREQAWQAAVLHSDWMGFFNWYYETVHFPLTGAFLAWVFFRHAPHYARVRNSFVVATLVGFLMHWTWPLLPPRLLPESYGFVDTIGAHIYGDGSKLGPFANQVAAMPSLHFGWSLTCGVGVVLLSSSRVRWAALAHPALTFVAIVVTANHYFLDAVVAVPVMGLGLAATLWKPLATLGDARSAEARKADAASDGGEVARNPPADA